MESFIKIILLFFYFIFIVIIEAVELLKQAFCVE